MSKLFKTTSLILATLVFGVVVAGCVKKPVSQVNVNELGNQNVNASSSSTFLDLDSASDFKIYKNNIFGFQFKIPKGWNIQEVQGSDGGPLKVSVRFYDNNKTYDYKLFLGVIQDIHGNDIDITSADKFKQWHKVNMVSNYLESLILGKINKNNVVEAVENDGIDSVGRYYYFLHRNTVIYIRSAKDNDNVSNEILSSIIFIE